MLDLTPEEKFFYVYLLTCDQGNIIGAFELPIKIVEMQTGYNRESIEKLISRFIDYGKIIYDQKTKEICLVNWLKHNGNTSEKLTKKYLDLFAGIKSLDIKNKVLEVAHLVSLPFSINLYPIDTVSIPYPYPSHTTTLHNTDTTQHNTTTSVGSPADAAHQEEGGDLLELLGEDDPDTEPEPAPDPSPEPDPIPEPAQGKKQTQSIAYDDESISFIGIDERQMAVWQEAYPAIDVPGEIARAAAWLRANPKNRKSNYARFLTNWLSRAQDKAPRCAAPPSGSPTWARNLPPELQRSNFL